MLIAATPAMLKKYQPFINLWRCYALRHGHAFLLETDEGTIALLEPWVHTAQAWDTEAPVRLRVAREP